MPLILLPWRGSWTSKRTPKNYGVGMFNVLLAEVRSIRIFFSFFFFFLMMSGCFLCKGCWFIIEFYFFFLHVFQKFTVIVTVLYNNYSKEHVTITILFERIFEFFFYQTTLTYHLENSFVFELRRFMSLDLQKIYR